MQRSERLQVAGGCSEPGNIRITDGAELFTDAPAASVVDDEQATSATTMLFKRSGLRDRQLKKKW